MGCREVGYAMPMLGEDNCSFLVQNIILIIKVERQTNLIHTVHFMVMSGLADTPPVDCPRYTYTSP